MNSFDDIWNKIYESGHINRYPWDSVVSFIFRHFPRSKAKADIRVLELGCGAGNNLWFCAKEGFKVIGVDASPQALNFAKARFAQEQLTGEFLQENFTQLSLQDNSIDMVFDRASLTCTPFSVIQQTIEEVHRVLKPGGKFLFIPYADSHSSAASGVFDAQERMVKAITAGTLVDVGQICFVSLNDIKSLFPLEKWNFVQIERAENTNVLNPQYPVHAEYRVIVEKKGV